VFKKVQFSTQECVSCESSSIHPMHQSHVYPADPHLCDRHCLLEPHSLLLAHHASPWQLPSIYEADQAVDKRLEIISVHRLWTTHAQMEGPLRIDTNNQFSHVCLLLIMPRQQSLAFMVKCVIQDMGSACTVCMHELSRHVLPLHDAQAHKVLCAVELPILSPLRPLARIPVPRGDAKVDEKERVALPRQTVAHWIHAIMGNTGSSVRGRVSQCGMVHHRLKWRKWSVGLTEDVG